MTHATSVLNSADALTARQVADVGSALNTAGTLDPDLQVDILRGELLQVEHKNAAALAEYRSIVRREPDNLLAWDLLAQAGDPSALAEVARLEPKVPGR